MQPPVGDLGSVGEKQLSTGKATVALSLITDPQALPDGTSAPVLSIGLEHNQ